MLKRIKRDSGKVKNLIISPKIMAIKKLVPGPATDTFKVPHFWSWKLKGLMGTGFAQPKIGPWPKVKMSKIKGRKMVPTGSMCFRGFKVRRPASFAVGSPKDKATLP